jgi:outer membrane protein assembly factor BamB
MSVGGCLRSQAEGDETETVAPQDGTNTPTATETQQSATTQERTTREDTETDTSDLLTERWSAPGSRFSVSDGVVYGNNGLRLAAWRLDGDQLWSREVEDSNTNATPVADDGTLYAVFGIEDATLRALDAANGSDKWTAEADGRVRSDPLPAGDAVLANVTDLSGEDSETAILGFDRSGGDRIWTQAAGSITSYASRALGTVDSDGFAYVTAGTTFDGARVSKIDPETGERVWDWEEPTPASEPVYVDGTVYVGAYERIVALNADDGTKRWEVETLDQNPAPPTVGGDVVYAGSYDTGVYAIAAQSGEQRWRYQTDGSVVALTVGDEYVYAGTGEGTLFAIDEDGERAGHIEYEDSIESLTYDDGMLLVGATETVAYEVKRS